MSAKKQIPRIRLDELLVARGLCESRTQAKGLILSGKVRHGTEVCDKPGREIPEDWELTIIQPPQFVSRGGEKLTGFLAQFPFEVAGLRVLDVGASTGGFTDCLLQRGAVHSTCVDVGYGQLHAKLRDDPRVTNLERVNARNLEGTPLPFTSYDLLVMDLSFISLTKVLPSVWPFLKEGGRLIALVKPQFEATKAEADKGRGIIRDTAIHERILGEIREFVATQLPGSSPIGYVPSPIKGADGNQEFLLGWGKQK
ncbi:MAG: TlyA family RNA methyltransferase [Verrucomicrobiota bacterium]|nr:TlyA family RNA methyltransferase [Verrucomicrobiota bacterium]